MGTYARPKLVSLLGALISAAMLMIAAPQTGSASEAAPRGVSSAVDPSATQSNSISALLGGIPETANALGKPTAPVTLVYFADLECPICRAFDLGALRSLIHRWVRTGKLRIVYASLETATREPETFLTQQVAALAAGAQHKAWYFIEIFYHEQGAEDSGYVTERYLAHIARQIHGLNFAHWKRARVRRKYSAQVEGDAQAADKLRLTGTPSFQIGRTGGPLKLLEYESLTDPQLFNRAIERVLAG